MKQLEFDPQTTLTAQFRSPAPWDLGYVPPTETLLEGIKFYHDYRITVPTKAA